MEKETGKTTVPPTHGKDYRIFESEVHLTNIECALLGLDILQDAHAGDAEDAGDIENVRLYLLNRLNEHTTALRKSLFPKRTA